MFIAQNPPILHSRPLGSTYANDVANGVSQRIAVRTVLPKISVKGSDGVPQIRGRVGFATERRSSVDNRRTQEVSTVRPRAREIASDKPTSPNDRAALLLFFFFQFFSKFFFFISHVTEERRVQRNVANPPSGRADDGKRSHGG